MSSYLEMVDELYAGFVATLPAHLRVHGRALAHQLRLAPSPDVPWSQVFGHEVTLAAPALFAEAMPGVSPRAVREAVMAQSLAAIEAFGTDRIEDAQVAATPELVLVLEYVRRARDASLLRVCPGVADPEIDFQRMGAKTLAAIREERTVYQEGAPVTFAHYERTSLGKQSVGFPASLALAHAAGWDASKRIAASEALGSIWLGLQLPDDVHDWEDDQSRGGAWAVVVAGARPELGDMRKQVFASGVLPKLLARGRWHFGNVRRLATALGAPRLAAWGAAQEARVGSLLENERKSAGYTARHHALIAWAREVLG